MIPTKGGACTELGLLVQRGTSSFLFVSDMGLGVIKRGADNDPLLTFDPIIVLESGLTNAGGLHVTRRSSGRSGARRNLSTNSIKKSHHYRPNAKPNVKLIAAALLFRIHHAPNLVDPCCLLSGYCPTIEKIQHVCVRPNKAQAVKRCGPKAGRPRRPVRGISKEGNAITSAPKARVNDAKSRKSRFDGLLPAHVMLVYLGSAAERA